MKFSNRTLTQVSLACGVLCGLFAQAVAEDGPAGVTRIGKPRKPVKVEQTGFVDLVGDAADLSEEAMESLAGPPHRGGSEVPMQNVSYGGNVSYSGNVSYYGPGNDALTNPYGSPACGPYGAGEGAYCQDDWRTHDWSCDCKSCRFHNRTRNHSLAMEQCWHGTTGHGPGCYYHDRTGRSMLNYFHCKFGFLCPSGNGGAGTPWFGCYTRVYPQDVNHFDQRDGQLYSAQGYGVPIAVPLAPTVGHTYNYGWGVPSSRLTPISTVAPR